MKSILLIASVLMGGLTSCGGGVGSAPTSVANVTGAWNGTLSYQGNEFMALTTTMKQTDTPNPGDYTGTLTLSGGESTPIVGNVNQGSLTMTEVGGSIRCQGTFVQAARYDGTCTFPYDGQIRTVNITLKKR